MLSRITHQLILLLLLCLLVSCVPLSERKKVELIRPDMIKVVCFEPPPDVIVKAGKFDANIAVKKIGELVKGTVEANIDPQRIREIAPDVNAFEVMQFRFCVDYGNGAFTPAEYQKFIRDIVPIYRKQEVETLRWKKVDIVQKVAGQTNYLKAPWTDISWIDDSEGWLCGIREGGGGGGDVGRGILLRTKDGGITWSEVDKQNFNSGKGQFTWGPTGTYVYTWSEVGPITSMLFYKRHLGGSQYRTEGWLSSYTGVYATDDGGENWERKSPPPDHPQRYAHFARIVDIEGFHQIYAVGWQGISHWPGPNGNWELQMPTYSYAVGSVFVGPDREIWAVGHAPNFDKRSYQGAIYYLAPRFSKWEIVRLSGIELEFDQSFTDIFLTDYTIALVIGQKGLILRGVRNRVGDWAWIKVPSNTEETLNSITYADNRLWVVGSGGVILYSVDKGEHWTKLPTVKDEQGLALNLNRVRFFGHTGWIAGDGVVLRLGKTRSDSD